MKTCKNCQNNFTGKYCNQCGQEDFDPPFDVKGFFKDDIKNEIIGFDNGFVFTVKKFLFSPGEAIYNFINGIRVGYIKPFAFILVAIAFSELVNKYTNIAQYYPPMREDGNFMTKILNYIQNDPKWLMVLQIPIFAWVTSIIFKKYKVDFGDHFLFNIYALSMLNVIGAICFLPLIFVTSSTLFGICIKLLFLLSAVYYTLIAYQFFSKIQPNMSGTFLKSLIAMVLGFVCLIAFYTVLAIIENV